VSVAAEPVNTIRFVPGLGAVAASAVNAIAALGQPVETVGR
jgi:hypothetical protein